MNEQQNKTQKFTIKMQKKLAVLYVLVLLAFAGLCVRLVWIVRENGTQYQKQIYSQQKYDSTTIPFRRGDIVDAKGTKLATSEKVYNLVIDASVMTDDAKCVEPTIQALRECFPDFDIDDIQRHVTQNKESKWYLPDSKKKLTYDQVKPFHDMEAENKLIKGVWFEEEYRRFYPGGSLAADVIGFVGRDNVGQFGLEEYYSDVLNGTNGRTYGYLNDDSNLERTTKAAVDGNTIHTTIDSNIQAIVEKHLAAFDDQYANNVRVGNGAENVGCIIMEVDTGNILAMASSPTFDLNNPQRKDLLIGSNLIVEETNANGYIEHKKTKTIITQELLDGMSDPEIQLNLNNLWKNFCISDSYEPGSTMKPFTVAAGLESGSINKNVTYECGGSLEVGGHTIRCHNRYGDGVLNLEQAVARSCNVALMKIAQATGKETFSKYQSEFNFGLRTNVDLAGEARTASFLHSAAEMDAADLATYSFGQSFNVTMIQMITGFCSLINGGYYYEPHLVDKITNSAGAVVKNIEPRLLKRTISESTSELIRQYCRAVVMDPHGTGSTARPAGYVIGGKTGTAQTIPRGNGEYVVSFMGYAPENDPKIAIYVVVDRCNNAPQDDAKYATRIVRAVLTEVLPYLNIFMTEELSEKEQKELEALHLADTNRYAEIFGIEDDPDEEGGEEPAYEGEGELRDPVWMSFPVDPNTGNLVDPNTGEQLDPATGDVIGGGRDALDGEI